MWIKEHREEGNWERRNTSDEGISASGLPCPVIKKKKKEIHPSRLPQGLVFSAEWFWAMAVGSMGVQCETYLAIK